MTKAYEIGPFRLDVEARVLSRDGVPVALGSRGVAVLATLIARPYEFVQKASIMDAAWPGVVVEESNLAVQISAIRHAFAKVPGGERWIETLPRRGYRFVGPLTELPNDLPGVDAGAIERSNLPAPLTSFVGREREVVEIKRLLPGKRLLTLVGVGGIGKTRLALQVAAEVVDAYRDGVWLVEFGSITDPALVPASVAQVFGVQERTGVPLTNTLCAHLSSRQSLLLLDNCEHLLDACGWLADAILRAAAQATIIATSREPLHVAGEQTYLLPTLSLPDPTASAEVMGQSEAVELFVERARRQRFDFELDAGHATTVAQLCIHLDGIPLALELAAARVRSLSVEQINARIDDRFRLLTDGARTVLPRQQTLRATLDWSYDLLHEGEKALLRRLSVFAGGWTLDAAERICSGERPDDGEMFDLLTSLADKSLVMAEERGGATRYRLLETVRQYSLDRLRECREDAQWQRRHFAFYLALSEQAEPQLTGAQQQNWLSRLEMEHDNLRSALAWSTTADGDAAGGLRLAGSLWRFWYVRGYLREGRAWLSGLLAAAPGGQAAAARAKALSGAGGLAVLQGDYPAARALYEECLGLRRGLDDPVGIARALNNLGNVAREQGDYSAAQALYEDSLAMKREHDNRSSITLTLSNLGLVAYDQGHYAPARALYEESLAIAREIGDSGRIAASLNNLGEVARDQGDYLASRALYEESLAISRELGDRRSTATSLVNLGNVANDQGEYPSARALLEQSLAIQRDLGDRAGMAESLEGLGYVEFRLAGPGRAARLWGAAERLREQIGAPMRVGELPRYDRQVAAARAAVGDATTFGAAWQEGRAQTLEQAVRDALHRHDS